MKSVKKAVALLLILVLLLFVCCSCNRIAESGILGMNKNVPTSTDTPEPSADASTQESSAVVSWPDEFPSEMPAFHYGSIDPEKSCKGPGSPGGNTINYMLIYRNVSIEDVNAYAQELKDAGLFVTRKDKDDGVSYTALYKAEGQNEVGIAFGAPKDGRCMVVAILTIKEE